MSDDPTKVEVLRLGSGGALIKRWRLPEGRATSVFGTKPGLINIWIDPNKRPTAENLASVGVYLDPDTGRFYTRVPEVEDGALYISNTLNGLRELVQLALQAYHQADEPVDTRTWTRVIRIGYPQPSSSVGDWRNPAHGGGSHQDWNNPGWLHGHRWSQVNRKDIEADEPGTGSDIVGPLSVSRLEWAKVPGSEQRDLREWKEDFDQRTLRYQTRKVHDSRDGAAPTRWEAREHCLSGAPEGGVEVPWDEQTWEALFDFQERIRTLDRAIRRLLTSEPEVLLARLTQPLLLGSGPA